VWELLEVSQFLFHFSSIVVRESNVKPEQHLCGPPFPLDLVNERLWQDAQAVYKAMEKLAASRAKPVARLTVDVMQCKEVA